MNPQIENYITNNYYFLLNICRSITNNHHLYKDLLHDVIIQLYDKKSSIVLDRYSEEQMKYYIVSVIRINWFSKTSPFYYRWRKNSKVLLELNQVTMEIPEETNQLEFETQIIYDILEEEYGELDWFRKSILNLYLQLGSMNKVSSKTKIPISSIRRYMSESRQQIKSNIKARINNI